MTEMIDAFRGRYREALSGYLDDPDEDALRAAYELGREAVSDELTVLDLAVVHHDALIAALAETPPSEHEAIAAAARDFLVESLSAFEMVRRGFRDAREAALLEQRHAAILRQLSNFLADASVELDAAESLEEILQLVVEQARELLTAARCTAQVIGRGDRAEVIEASSASSNGASTRTDDDRLAAALIGWDGRELGTIEVFDKAKGEFGEVDAAVLQHLAQMTSAAVERSRLYRRER
jgi:Phosphoserine phosphatase RsbU, N-terminal domain